MVVLTGMPESAVVLVAFSVQVFVELLRSEPPVVTKLMRPVSRDERAMVCASATRAPHRLQIISNERRHPRVPSLCQEPRMPRLDGTLMRLNLRSRAAPRRHWLS